MANQSSPAIAQRFYQVEEVYPFLTEFKQHTDVLVRELTGVLSDNWMPWPEQHLYDAADQWDIFPFFGFGREVPQNIERCPETYSLIKTVPKFMTAIYSRLGPQSKINPHLGPANLANYVLRCHLGLIVPDQCGIWVEGETRAQKFGEWLVFDDSKSHAGFNGSTEQRIVLLLDIERPAWVPKGQGIEQATADAGGLPDNWGIPDDYLKRNY